MYTKEGLPSKVIFCKKCVTSNQRVAPSVTIEDIRDSKKDTVYFHTDGICEACRVVGKKNNIDWEARELELIKLLDTHRSKTGNYDCIVPGSGGKDSVFASHILKHKYGMNPLTITWSPHIYTEIGWQNFQSWVDLGNCDNYLFTPNGRVNRKLTSLAFSKLLHPFQPFTMGQRYFPSRMAKQLNIPLVFYGENAAEYGTVEGEDASSLVPLKYISGGITEKTRIAGCTFKELETHGISADDIKPYLPLNTDDFERGNIEAHYLGHFLKWVPQECYYYAVEHTNFCPNPERSEGTFSKYNSIDDKLDGFHYWCGYIKFGIGRCTHEASQEIRNGHIEREEAIALVKRFDGEFPKKYYEEILQYLDLDHDTFMGIADSFRSEHLWEKTKNSWKLRHTVC